MQVSRLLYPRQVVTAQGVTVDGESLASLLGSDQVVGWIHDHHALGQAPTIDYDAFQQYHFQKDLPYFMMIIVGEAIKKRRPSSASWWFIRGGWCRFYQLTADAMQVMRRVHGEAHESQEQRATAFRQAVGVMAPLHHVFDDLERRGLHCDVSAHIEEAFACEDYVRVRSM